MTCQEAFELWFSSNGKLIDKVSKDSVKTKAPQSVTLPIDRCAIGPSEFLIIPESAMIISAHPHFFGFYKDGDKLVSRYFWMSRSEGCWRSGTGFRPVKNEKGELCFGGFTKGQEHIIHAGYTFETQLHPLLEKRLTELYEQRSLVGITEMSHGEFEDFINGFVEAEVIKDGPKLKKDKIKRFLIRPEGEEGKDLVVPEGCIVKLYEHEVTYVDALEPALHDAKIVMDKAEKTLGSVSLQKKSDSKVDELGLKDFKKATSPLWEAVTSCLKHPRGAKYGYFSKLLDSDVNVEAFDLKKQVGKVKLDVVIEIAYTTKSFNMRFKDKSQTRSYEINSPMCWVKSVYLDTGVSSFGNFKQYPWDLCFLPQKPMDYSKQISRYLKGRQNEHNQYTFIALFDEKYSPLIQEFKKAKGYRLFVSSYIKQTLESYINIWSDREVLERLLHKVIDSCDEYVRYNDRQSSSKHGATGRDRAMAFGDAVAACTTFDELNRLTYQLFAKNMVGRKCYAGFLFGGKIQTRASSYIVFFCDAIYSLTKFVDPGYKIPATDKRLKGEARCIVRAVLYMVNNNIQFHATDSRTLEGILEAMKANV